MAAAWYNLADVHEEAGRLDDTVRCYRAALKACPAYADAHFNLALCYKKVSRRLDADRHWRAYIKLDSSSEWADVARSHITEA